MKGLEAVKHAAKDAGVEIITYVPGYPINELAEATSAEISVNEKVALEIALGASATGCRSMVIVKQVGMNLLADPLVISATHTIGSGLVVIVGDDLGPKGSQAEMDSRYYGQLANLPFLDPSDPAKLYYSIIEAYNLSEGLRVPAIIRVTPRLISLERPNFNRKPTAHRGLGRESGRESGPAFERIAWNLTVRGRHQRHHQEILPLAKEASEASTLNSIEISGKVGIIASGFPASLAEGLGASPDVFSPGSLLVDSLGVSGLSHLFVGYTNPLPWNMIKRFVEGHRLILVAEEPEPFIESQLQMSPKIRGKLTGHLPFGPLEMDDLVLALENLEKKPERSPQSYESTAQRGYTGICDDCPFIPLYRALGKLDVPVAGDAGCAIRATRQPYESVDVVYGLGSSIGVASGFRKKGVAVIGDFALAHTGLPALVNAVWQKRDVLVVLLKNDVAAMTGGQEAPDLTKLLGSLVPACSLDLAASEDEIEKVLREKLERPGTSAVVAFGSCPRIK